MRLNSSLNAYLLQDYKQAYEMAFQLVKQLIKQEGVTEEKKRRNQTARVCAMNIIHDQVNEFALNKTIIG